MPRWSEAFEGLPETGDLFGPERDPRPAISEARRELGLPDAYLRQERRAGPDVSGLRRALGPEFWDGG